MKILSRTRARISDIDCFGNNSDKQIVLRNSRIPLLNAFDIYKSNVYYGVIAETEEQHEQIVAWYHDLRDLKPSAFENIPSGVAMYVKK